MNYRSAANASRLSAIPATEMKLPWIEGTTRPFDGDDSFGE